MEAKSKAHPVQRPPNGQFRPRVSAANASHYEAALFRGPRIHLACFGVRPTSRPSSKSSCTQNSKFLFCSIIIRLRIKEPHVTFSFTYVPGPNQTRAFCCGRFRPHSKERFVRRAEDLAIQRLFAFRPMRLTARFDRRSALRFGVIVPPRVRALAKTRMNTRFPPANGGPKRAVTNILTRVLLS